MHRRLPVTLIGGFLGAGKTSLLHHLVTEHQGGHLAILVENPAALNPDIKALRGLCGAMGRKYDTVEEIAPGDETSGVTAEKLRALAEAGRYERVLVEVSGTTDAARWVRYFQGSAEGQSAGVWAELEQVVCVVDLVDFYRSFVARSDTSSLRDFQKGQVESASLIVLNKCDLLGDNERQQSTRLLRALNSEAQIIETDYGEVPPSVVFRAARQELLEKIYPEKSIESAGDLESIVYRAYRPFHPARFWEWFNASHEGVLRVKGMIWLATRNLLVGGVSRTVWQNGCGAAGIWWTALPREEWPSDVATLEEMQAVWREPYGDRRQELVLIGASGPTGTAARQLNHCLLNNQEYARPREEWCAFPDPFPAWDLESE
jgi:G3E family GTPase